MDTEQQKLDIAPKGGVYIVNGWVVDANGVVIPGYSIIDGEAVKDKPVQKPARDEKK